MSYCDELHFGIISLHRFLIIEKMNIISSHDEMACKEHYEETPKCYVPLAIKLLEKDR